MNYSCFIVKIINDPIRSQFEDNVSLAEMMVKFSIVRKKKTIEEFRVLVWGNLAEDIIKYYKKNDYIIIEGYLRNISEPGMKDQVEISAKKVYPFLLKNPPKDSD
jgi:single-stranded DNA-binding protein